MIVEILYLIFFTSSIVLAWRTAISKSMILECIGNYAEYKIERGEKWRDIYSCPWCLPTIGTLVSWIFMFSLEVVPFTFDWTYVAIHLIGWWSCAFICGMAWTYYLTMNAKKESYEASKEYHIAATKYYEHAEKIAHFEIKDRKEQHYKKQHPHNGVKNN